MSKVPKLRFKEFSGEWEEKILGKISDVRDGTHDSPKYYNGGYPLITSKNLLANGMIDFQNVNLILEEDYININKRSKVNIGDILFGMIGTIGNPVIVKQEGFAIKNVALIKEQKILLNKFLIHYLKSSFVEKQFYKQNTGGTQKFIALGIIREMIINLPCFEEQIKIANFISSVDTKIEQLTKKESLLQEYKKGVMQKIFNQEIRFKDDNGKEFPEWEEKKLGEIFHFLRGSSLSKSDIAEDGINKCIHYGELFTIYKEKIAQIKSSTNLTDGQFSKIGDILMPSSDVTPQGLATASAIFEENVIVGGDTNILRPKKAIDSLFVSYFLNSNKNEIMKAVTGTTVKHIYNKDVAKLKIYMPIEIKEQTKIANLLSSIDKKIELISKEIEKAKEFKKGLLQQMFV